jgi:hypothetical protein
MYETPKRSQVTEEEEEGEGENTEEVQQFGTKHFGEILFLK